MTTVPVPSAAPRRASLVAIFAALFSAYGLASAQTHGPPASAARAVAASAHAAAAPEAAPAPAPSPLRATAPFVWVGAATPVTAGLRTAARRVAAEATLDLAGPPCPPSTSPGHAASAETLVALPCAACPGTVDPAPAGITRIAVNVRGLGTRADRVAVRVGKVLGILLTRLGTVIRSKSTLIPMSF